MKKIISLVMALALVMCMGVTAFAAESPEAGDVTIEDLSEQKNQEITATMQATVTEADTIYSVKIAWEDLQFSYTKAQPTGWTPSSHSYSNDTEGSWNKESAKITVTNDSNAAVNASATYVPGTEEMYGASLDCAGAEETTLNAGDQDNIEGVVGDNVIEISLNVSGSDPTQSFGPVTAGTVTVTLEAAASEAA